MANTKYQDFLGQDASQLRNKRFFILDMDGTVFTENILIDGATEFVECIEKQQGCFIFVSNNSSKSVKDYAIKLNKMGFKVEEKHFFTSTLAVSLLLKEKYRDVLVYCQGTKSMIHELQEQGIRVTEEVSDDVGVILVGNDNEMTSEKLRKTCFLLGRDIPYYATNCDIRCPVDFGYVPDCGSICNMLESSTGRAPIFIGKPEPTMANLVMKKLGFTKEETVLIGDRMYTDIASGLNAGVMSICVLSGDSTIEEIQESPIKPTLVFKSVKEIAEIIK